VKPGEFTGYTVTYGRDEIQFPVYVTALIGAVLLAAGIAYGLTILFAIGAVSMAFAVYNVPLLETTRIRLGANQYGVFIEGFGLIAWRAIDRIELVAIAQRAMTVNELQIALKLPLGRALLADWRKVPPHRMIMRLPWSMTYDNVVRVSLDSFDKPPEDIHRTMQRMWRYYRG